MSFTAISRSSALIRGIDQISGLQRPVPRELIAATQEVAVIKLLMSAGALFGLAGRAIFMLGTRSPFSIPSLTLHGLFGLLGGTFCAFPAIHSFSSNLSSRETILNNHNIGQNNVLTTTSSSTKTVVSTTT